MNAIAGLPTRAWSGQPGFASPSGCVPKEHRVHAGYWGSAYCRRLQLQVHLRFGLLALNQVYLLSQKLMCNRGEENCCSWLARGWNVLAPWRLSGQLVQTRAVPCCATGARRRSGVPVPGRRLQGCGGLVSVPWAGGEQHRRQASASHIRGVQHLSPSPQGTAGLVLSGRTLPNSGETVSVRRYERFL